MMPRKPVISKDSEILLSETKFQSPTIVIDGNDYADSLHNLEKDTIEKLIFLLNFYKDKSYFNHKNYECELWHMSLLIWEQFQFLKMPEGIENEQVKKRFSFLFDSPFFFRCFEDNEFYYFQFQGKRSMYGEVQYLYIKIPTEFCVSRHIQSNFKFIKNGKDKRYGVKERPYWFRQLWEKSKQETREMFRIEKLFI